MREKRREVGEREGQKRDTGRFLQLFTDDAYLMISDKRTIPTDAMLSTLSSLPGGCSSLCHATRENGGEV